MQISDIALSTDRDEYIARLPSLSADLRKSLSMWRNAGCEQSSSSSRRERERGERWPDERRERERDYRDDRCRPSRWPDGRRERDDDTGDRSRPSSCWTDERRERSGPGHDDLEDGEIPETGLSLRSSLARAAFQNESLFADAVREKMAALSETDREMVIATIERIPTLGITKDEATKRALM